MRRKIEHFLNKESCYISSMCTRNVQQNSPSTIIKNWNEVVGLNFGVGLLNIRMKLMSYFV